MHSRRTTVGILSMRCGARDGVSVEASKLEKVGRDLGYNVRLIAGEMPSGDTPRMAGCAVRDPHHRGRFPGR